MIKFLILLFVAPKGFVYTQLDNQTKPEELFPSIVWKDISNLYSGLYFRAEGGASKWFGEVQKENSKQLTAIKAFVVNDENENNIEIRPGMWSKNITLGLYRKGKDAIGLRVKTSKDVVKVSRSKKSWIWRVENTMTFNTSLTNDSYADYHIQFMNKLEKSSRFIYVQFPNQKSPKELWPQQRDRWKDITTEYSGHFFRVAEQSVNESVTKSEVISLQSGDHFGQPLDQRIDVSSGQWSRYVLSGSYGGVWVGLRMRFITNEVRPINTAIRIWKL